MPQKASLIHIQKQIRRNIRRDVVLIVIISLLAFVLFSTLDVYESLHQLLLQKEVTELDDILPLFSVLCLCLAVFSLRRWHENHQLMKLFRQQASYDPLTGLINRRVLDLELERCSQQFIRHGSPCSIVLIDIDHFKQVNDEHGHQTGDEVLVEVARRISDTCRKSDVAGRWGGEEFMVICPHSQAQQVVDLAERMRKAIADQSFPHVGHISISIGIADATQAPSPDALLSKTVQLADEALYEAKSLGRNRVCQAHISPSI